MVENLPLFRMELSNIVTSGIIPEKYNFPNEGAHRTEKKWALPRIEKYTEIHLTHKNNRPYPPGPDHSLCDTWSQLWSRFISD